MCSMFSTSPLSYGEDLGQGCGSHITRDVGVYLLREKLAVQKAGSVPLDMDQFRMLFCTCKVPGVTTDTIHNYFKTGEAWW